MNQPRLNHRAAGGALLVGYAILLATFFRDPASGLAAATASPGTLVIGLVFPILGLIAGGYVYLGWTGTAVVGLLGASFLGVWGLALSLFVTGNLLVVRGVGLSTLALSVIALIGSLRSVFPSFDQR